MKRGCDKKTFWNPPESPGSLLPPSLPLALFPTPHSLLPFPQCPSLSPHRVCEFPALSNFLSMSPRRAGREDVLGLRWNKGSWALFNKHLRSQEISGPAMFCRACPCQVIANSRTSSFYQRLVSRVRAGRQSSVSPSFCPLAPVSPSSSLLFLCLHLWICVSHLSLSPSLAHLFTLSLSFLQKWKKENYEFSFGFKF